MLETILYVSETIKYAILYRLVFKKNLKRPWVAVLFGVLYIILFLILWSEFDVSGKGVVCKTLTVVSVFGMQDGKWKKRGNDTLVVWLLSLILEMALLVPLEIMDLYMGLGERWGREINIVVSVVGGTILFLIYTRRKIQHPNKTHIELSKRMLYTLVLIMAVVMLITASGFNFAGKYVPVKWFSVVVIILTAVSYFSIGLLGIFVVHIRHVNEKLDEMLQNEILLKKTERTYYEAMLEKEEETRRYRHDMIGHLVCLNAFAMDQRTKELQEYVQTLQQQFTQIQKKCYSFGNAVLDAITNHYLMELDQGIDVHVEGTLCRTLALDDVALCTIYDNLLKNALEELKRIEEGEKKLFISFLQGVNNCEITIRNSISERSKAKEKMLVTEKEDSKNHGLGLKNVKNVLEKYGGDLNLQKDESFFTASVRLKNSIE